MVRNIRVRQSVRSVLWAPVLLVGISAATSLSAPMPARANDVKVDAARTTSDPMMTSWATQNGGQYARVVQTRGGSPTTTWPAVDLPRHGGGQDKPAYSDIQQVSYSADWVYVRGTGLASHQMGPWYINVSRIFDNWPSNQNYLRRTELSHRKLRLRRSNRGRIARGEGERLYSKALRCVCVLEHRTAQITFTHNGANASQRHIQARWLGQLR